MGFEPTSTTLLLYRVPKLLVYKISTMSSVRNSHKAEKPELDRSQLSEILATIGENERLKSLSKVRKTLPRFQPTTSKRHQPKTLVEKLASRVYFADRVKYGEGERVGRVSFQNNGGRPFQLPRIESQQTYRWVRISEIFAEWVTMNG